MASQDNGYCGQVTFGGAGFGAVTAEVKLADGTDWTFAGYLIEAGTPTVGYGNVYCNGFPGEGHMPGRCSFEIADGGLGPGGFEICWFDLHGQIGTVWGYAFGGGAAFGMGWGDWVEKTAVPLPSQLAALAAKVAEDAAKQK
jgi:hypothetical protein